MTSTLIAVDTELLEEIMVEVFDSPVWDKIEDYDPEIREQAELFCKELNDIGINSTEGWEDRFYGVADNDVHFLQELLEDSGEEWPEFLVIDWQASWDRNYCYDFNVIPWRHQNWYFHNS
jgi:hypothetical protein